MTGRELRKIRESLRATQEEFAEMLGYSASQISNLESGIDRSTGRPSEVPRVVELALAPIKVLLSARLQSR